MRLHFAFHEIPEIGLQQAAETKGVLKYKMRKEQTLWKNVVTL